MSAARHRVALLTNCWAPYKEPLLAELARHVDLTVYYCSLLEPNREWRVELSGAYRHRVLPGVLIRLPGMFMHLNPAIVGALRRERPDLLIVGGYSYPTVVLAALASRALGIPTILWSGSTSLKAESRLRRLAEPVKRRLVGLYSGYLAYTSRAAEYLASLGASPERITVAPITVDVSLFAERAAALRERGREELRERLGIAPGEVVVVFVGRLVEIKGGDVLLRALATLREFPVRLLMVGSGPCRGEWERLAESLGIGGRVAWCGHLPQEELAERYAAADLMVLPSWEDQSGNVTNEAMAAGLPVVLSDRVGTDAVRDGRDGLVFPAGDTGALAAALRRLVEDGGLRERLGRSARVRALEEFSIEYEAACFAAAVDRVLSAPGGAAR